jgi:DNA primase catalytic core
MSPDEKEQLRTRTDIVELISTYTALKQSAGTFKGLCPFHSERTPSFVVYPDRGSWRCFGQCGEGGDVFKFLMKVENLSFIEAAERLASKLGITLSRGGMDAEEAGRQRDDKERLYAINAEAVRYFRSSLPRARLASEYVTQRGLIHQTLENFGVGFAPEEWSALSRHLASRDYSMGDAEAAGLSFSGKREGEFTDKFRGRLMFPIIDVQERVVGFGGRLIPNPEVSPEINRGPKYLNSPETPIFSKSRILYGLNRARKAITASGRLLVVEGYMDVVAAHQSGFENVVATLGTSLTEEHVKTLQRYTKTVVLSFDADEAGTKAALRAAELFAAHGPDFAVRVLWLPDGDDPDAMLMRGDTANFQRALDQALTVPEFRLRTTERKYDLTDESGRMSYLREALPILSDVRSSMELDLLVRRLAPLHPAFGRGGSRAEESLRSEVQSYRRGSSQLPDDMLVPKAPEPARQNYYKKNSNGSSQPYAAKYGRNAPPPPPRRETPTVPRSSALMQAERTVLRALLADDWYTETIREIGETDIAPLFDDPRAQELVRALRDLLAGRIAPVRAVGQLVDETLADYAMVYLVPAPDDEPLSQDGIADCLERLVERHGDRKVQKILSKLSAGESLTDDELRQYLAWKRATRGGDNQAPK